MDPAAEAGSTRRQPSQHDGGGGGRAAARSLPPRNLLPRRSPIPPTRGSPRVGSRSGPGPGAGGGRPLLLGGSDRSHDRGSAARARARRCTVRFRPAGSSSFDDEDSGGSEGWDGRLFDELDREFEDVVDLMEEECTDDEDVVDLRGDYGPKDLDASSLLSLGGSGSSRSANRAELAGPNFRSFFPVQGAVSPRSWDPPSRDDESGTSSRRSDSVLQARRREGSSSPGSSRYDGLSSASVSGGGFDSGSLGSSDSGETTGSDPSSAREYRGEISRKRRVRMTAAVTLAVVLAVLIYLAADGNSKSASEMLPGGSDLLERLFRKYDRQLRYRRLPQGGKKQANRGADESLPGKEQGQAGRRDESTGP